MSSIKPPRTLALGHASDVSGIAALQAGELGPPLLSFQQAPDGALRWMTPALASLLGGAGSGSKLDPSSFWAMVEACDRPWLQARLQNWPFGSEAAICQFRIRLPGTSRLHFWLDWRRPLPSATEGFEGFWLDLSHGWRLGQRARRLQGHEWLADQLGGYLHDLNNAVTAVASLADLCRLEAPDQGPLAGQLQQLAASTGHLRQLLQALGGAYQDENPAAPREQAWHDLAQLTRTCVERLRPALPRRIDLAIIGQEEPLPVWGDGTALRHAILQLLANAAQAIRAQGRITLETGRLPSSKPAVTDPPRAFLRVSDDGVGLLTEGDEVFDPGYGTRPGRAGLGLGLWFLRQAIEAAGGRVDLQSSPGRGTVVTCSLPLAEEDAEAVDACSLRRAPLLWADLAGGNTDTLFQTLRAGPWELVKVGSEPERVLAGSDLPPGPVVVWGGDLHERAWWHLEQLGRMRPAIPILVVVRKADKAMREQLALLGCRVVDHEAPDLLEQVHAWMDAR